MSNPIEYGGCMPLLVDKNGGGWGGLLADTLMLKSVLSQKGG